MIGLHVGRGEKEVNVGDVLGCLLPDDKGVLTVGISYATC